MANVPALPLGVRIFDDRDCLVGEGPVWDEQQDRVVWVDILGAKVLWRSLDGSATGECPTPHHVGAVLPAQGSHWLAFLPDGIYTLRLETGEMHLSRPFPDITSHLPEPRPMFRSNDAKVAPDGSVYVGVMPYDTATYPRHGNLYRLADGVLNVAVAKTTLSNGIAWSPDSTTMYFIDSSLGRIDAFDYDLIPVPQSRRTFAEIDSSWGVPDGLCVDDSGNLWVGLWGGHGVLGIDSAGEVIGLIEIPGRHATSCAFVGHELRTLAITSASLDCPPQAPAGAVFLVDMPTAGILQPRATIRALN